MSLPESLFDYEACLRACVHDERQALLSLYEQESDRLLGVARRIVRDEALVEDIVHDAFINIWTCAGSFDPARGSARGWTLSIKLEDLPSLQPNQLFELTLEASTGSQTGKPTGPVQFIGRALKVI